MDWGPDWKEATVVPGFEDLVVGCEASSRDIGIVQLKRPHRSNAFNRRLWTEFPQALEALTKMQDIRVVIVCGCGKNFCSGLDTEYLSQLLAKSQGDCPATIRESLRTDIQCMQAAFTKMEQCKWPVIAAVQGACVGAGVDLIAAADLRICSKDATFCVKEIDLAITADLGTLQRLPHIVGHGAAVAMSLTGAPISAQKAHSMGLVLQCLESPEQMWACVLQTAQLLAKKPPLGLMGAKRILLHARDHSVADGLDYVATYNSAMLLSKHLKTISQRAKHKQVPTASKL